MIAITAWGPWARVYIRIAICPDRHRLSSPPEDVEHAIESPMLRLTQMVDTLIDILKRRFMPADRQTKAVVFLEFIE